jgi:type I restriction enzyme S subunit
MAHWKEYKLGELANVKGGKRLPKGSTLTKIPNSHPYIRVRDMGNRYLTANDLEYVPENIFPVIKHYIVDKGNVILSIVGSVGLVSIVNDDLDKASLTENCVKVLPQTDKLSNEYLYYFLKSEIGQGEIKKKTVGAVQPKLPIYNINDIVISIPDLPTQTAIAEILSSLDDKIELNNQINKELEALAQALFKHWFIDFEFPDENGQPYKSSGGEMVESELGEIPKGWRLQTLDEISKISIGRTPPRKESQWFTESPSDVKWVSIRDMGNCGVYIHATFEYLTEEAVQKFNIPIIEANTVIISFKLTVGRVAISTEKMLSNEAIAHINLKQNVLFPEFVYLYLKQFNFDSLGSTSSIATAVNSKSVKAIPIIIPEEGLLSKFNKITSELFKQILNLTLETKELVALRDTLLPKLISGELEVSEVLTEKVK